MKVVHLSINEEFGGASKAANRLHHGLIKFGIDSKLLVINKVSNDNSVIRIADVYSKKERIILFLRKISNIINLTFKIKRDKRYNPPSLLLGVLNRFDFDIIHLHWVTCDFVNFKELIKIKKPIVWTMHDCAAFTGICHVIGNCNNFKTGCGRCPLIKSENYIDISSRELKRKKKIYDLLNLELISPSHWLYEQTRQSYILKDKKINIIPHGIDTELFCPIDKDCARKAFNLDNKTKIILCGTVTYADENKGIQYLMEAVKIISLLNKESTDLELLMFGEPPAQQLSFDIKTTQLGYIHDPRLLTIIFSLADVLVVPSKQEAFGLIALEGMSCGIPVVAFDATGLLDIVEHKKTGYLAKPYESTDLANGIKWCLENNTENELSENARKKVQESFNLKILVKKHIELYNSILLR